MTVQMRRMTSPSNERALSPANQRRLEEIYEAYFHTVQRWLLYFRCDRNELNDLTAKVFEVIRRKLDQFVDGDQPGLIWSICYGIARNHRRSITNWFRRFELAPDVVQVAGPDPERAAVLRAALIAVLSRLDEDDRMILLLRFGDRMTAAEIAVLFGTTEDSISSRVTRARNAFRKVWAALEKERP